MKTHTNLYPKLCSYENVFKAYRKARKGKSHKFYVKEFDEKLSENIAALRQELHSLSYKPSPLKKFTIHDPKTRVIRKSTFRDRIVHHAVVNILEPLYDKQFIYDSYANRAGKGTIAGLKRFDTFKRKVSDNGRLIRKSLNNQMIRGYILKADIRHFFDSVDQDILLDIFRRKIRDKKFLGLIEKILRNFDNPKVGMPLGNMTSQFFANIYLNDLDQFVKKRLKMKYYLRYVDDFVILHENKETLMACKIKIEKYLKNLRLELHPHKSKVFPLYRGVNLLGFKVFYFHKLLRKRNLKQFKKDLITNKVAYRQGSISQTMFLEKLQGWFAYVQWGDTYDLRKDIAENMIRFFEFTEKKPINKEIIYKIAKINARGGGRS